jgi:uncharacterized glyoxalase superfamily protein PhnB
MSQKVQPIPPGYHSLTPHLIIKGAGQAVDYYKKAFGAQELFRFQCEETGNVAHAELKIGDSILMICEESAEWGAFSPASTKGTPVGVHLYVENVDDVFDRAVKAGGKALMPVTDMFWGDRFGKLQDPFGHVWEIATHKEDLTPEEVAKRAKEFMAASQK